MGRTFTPGAPPRFRRLRFRRFGLVWRGDIGGSFEQFAFVEDRAGAHEGDQVRGVDGSPAGLCGGHKPIL